MNQENEMGKSVFSKIIDGEIPCHKVYEDEHTLAFLDVHPLLPGHVLVIPKQQIEFLWDLPEELYSAVLATTKKVAQRLREVTQEPYVHMSVIGTDVPHAHVHVVPFSNPASLKQVQDTTSEPDHTALALLAAKLAF